MKSYACQSVHSNQRLPHVCAVLTIAWENKQPTQKQMSDNARISADKVE